ncbi:hypothetical protein ACOBQX_21335 [Actinokineospora sp. G85]|uniref:hypothetical protein n=1 Tax=Actinokineospora sp. G85 TaxID=3406626 RepID=UPI003C710519
MRAPLAFAEPMVRSVAVAALSVLISFLLAMAGALSHWSTSTTGPLTASATVVAGSPCSSPSPELVRFDDNGTERTAPLDACGHSAGEIVEISLGSSETAHLISANIGTTFDARPIGVVLMICAGIAGAAAADFLRRTRPRPGRARI